MSVCDIDVGLIQFSSTAERLSGAEQCTLAALSQSKVTMADLNVDKVLCARFKAQQPIRRLITAEALFYSSARMGDLIDMPIVTARWVKTSKFIEHYV